MSLFLDINRLIREEEWDATDLAQEIYTILDGATVNGINGPLKINTQGSQPAIVLAPQSLTGGSPFQVQVGGTAYNYTFGSPTGSGPTAVSLTGGTNNFGGVTYGAGEYQPGGAAGGSTFTFNAGGFTPPALPDGWQGGGGTGGGDAGGGEAGGGSLVWNQLGATLNAPAGGSTAGYGTVSAVGRILDGSGSTYRVEVRGFNGGTFAVQATALGLEDGDKLDANTWHTLTAYVTPAGVEVVFTPAVFNVGAA